MGALETFLGYDSHDCQARGNWWVIGFTEPACNLTVDRGIITVECKVSRVLGQR